MRIVALVPGGIGDQLLFFPTLDGLKQVYPDAAIDVVVEPRAKDAYRVSQSVQDTLLFDFKGRNSLADWMNLLGSIRDREYDVVISLDQSRTVGFLLWLTGVPVRISYANSNGASLMTNTVPMKSNQYTAHMYHDLLTGLGIQQPCPELAVKVPAKDIDWADAERKRLGIGNGGYVLLHGGSSQRSQDKGIDKMYPTEKWKGIIQSFEQRQPDLPIVVIQGPDDGEWVATLVQSCPQVKVTHPDNVGQLTAMIAGASLMICTDSAPMHLAVALKTYTLALFGPTDPAKLLPQDNRFVGIKSFTNQMADIAPQTVLDKVWGG